MQSSGGACREAHSQTVMWLWRNKGCCSLLGKSEAPLWKGERHETEWCPQENQHAGCGLICGGGCLLNINQSLSQAVGYSTERGTEPGKGDEEKGSNWSRRLGCVEGGGAGQLEVGGVGRSRPAQAQGVWKRFRKVVQAAHHCWQTFSRKTESGWPVAVCASHWRLLGEGQYCVLQLRLQWDWKNIGCSPCFCKLFAQGTHFH